ncbi:hypothetical protein B9T25_13560 [Acinetobacter sp. ANC 4470]|uniref:hypothetical protein n=1 Tax=Acinetobacter sp. ANC 4470 TaxID=1977881 RepID=UPI000A35A114|nr:hypothetical protein [Acinetobacter sp. ANC 4470]OTG63958.1 hypothetical protein B9T25_13560 [Acinetobacter sp. ANC 4470]
MKRVQKFLSITIFSTVAVSAFAVPLPNSIVIQDKAVVPITKTQVIRTIKGQEPVRTVEATIFEVTNGGKDIVAREVVLQDNETQFSDKKMSAPIVKHGGVIVPTSKIEVKSTIKQDGVVIAEAKKIDAAGVEFKKGQQPAHKTLKLDQLKDPKNNESITHAVIKENGVTTKDIVVLKEAE